MPLVGLLTYVVSRYNHYGLKDAVLAAVGLKKYKSNPTIKILQALTILAPLGLAVWIIQSCPA